MKVLFKHKFLWVVGLLIMVLLLFGIWFSAKEGRHNGIIDIPGIQAERIMKSVLIKNDRIWAESVLITYNQDSVDMSHYALLKLENHKPLNELKKASPFTNRFRLYTWGFSTFKFWKFPPMFDKTDVNWYSSTTPLSKTELSDTVLIYNFNPTEIEISLSEDLKRDVGLTSEKPVTIALYEREGSLYFIYVSRPYEKDWVKLEELEQNLYPLVSAWELYKK